MDYAMFIRTAAKQYGFSLVKQICFSFSRLTRLLVELPIIAACEAPEQVASGALNIYFESLSGKYPHRNSMTIEERLLPLRDLFKTGNQDLINTAFLILELWSLYDHKTDMVSDKSNQKYNPISALDVSYTQEFIRLKHGVLNSEFVTTFNPIINIKQILVRSGADTTGFWSPSPMKIIKTLLMPSRVLA